MKKYLSEVLMISNETNSQRIYEWLIWHLHIIGFEHAVIIDNTNDGTLRQTCSLFENVEYHNLVGVQKQSDIYTNYVRNSNSYWVLPIDDDEYLYISDKYNHNINKLIYEKTKNKPIYKLSFNWLMMFNNSIKEDYLSVFSSSYDRYFLLNEYENEDFLCAKTMVNTLIKHIWCNDKPTINVTYESVDADVNLYTNVKNYNEHLGSVHNPVSKLHNVFQHAYNVTNDMVVPGFKGYKFPYDVNDCDGILLHFKYRTRSEWNAKITKQKFNDISPGYYMLNYTKTKFEKIYNMVFCNMNVFNKHVNLYTDYVMSILNKNQLPANINGKIIACLTCYPPRMCNLKDSLISLLTQSKKLDYIFITLSEEEFPNREKDIDPEILSFINKYNNIIKLVFVPLNTNVFKKWLPIANLYNGQNYYLISCDDDIFYDENYVKDIFKNIQNHTDVFSLFNSEKNIVYKSERSIDYPFGFFAVYNSKILNRFFNKNCMSMITKDIIEMKNDDLALQFIFKEILRASVYLSNKNPLEYIKNNNKTNINNSNNNNYNTENNQKIINILRYNSQYVI